MAKAVLAAILSATVLAAVPTGSAPVTPAQASVRDPAHTLATLSMEAGRLEGLAHALETSAKRCLADQATLLGPRAAGSGERNATSAALQARRAALSQAMGSDGALPSLDAVRTLDANVGGARERLVHHAALREACLDWAERSIEVVRTGLAGDAAELAAVRAKSGRDANFLRLIARRDTDEVHTVAIEAMETYGGPRR